MHSAVMQNKKYIEFAKSGTVEVLALQRLDEGATKKDRRAAAYRAKGPDGKPVLLMLEWPNLTYDEILAFNRTQAGQYNKTGKIPYTSIVNPHNLEEMKGLPGGQGVKALMEAAEEARRQLQKEHGKGLSRKEYDRIGDAEAKARESLAKGEFGKAIDLLTAATPQNAPEALAKRLSTTRESIVSAAEEALSAVGKTAGSDVSAAKKELSSLLPRLRGTGLEERAKELQKTLGSSE